MKPHRQFVLSRSSFSYFGYQRGNLIAMLQRSLNPPTLRIEFRPGSGILGNGTRSIVKLDPYRDCFSWLVIGPDVDSID